VTRNDAIAALQERAKTFDVVLRPAKDAEGWWAGAPSVVRDGAGVFWLACRMRTGEGVRGKRGYELRILRSDDGAIFSEVTRIPRESVPIPGFERPALIVHPKTKKLRLYGCGPLKDGPWCIFRWDDVSDLAKIDPTSARPVIEAPPPAYERDVSPHEYKDATILFADGRYHAYVIGYVRRSERIYHWVSDDGDTWKPVGRRTSPVMDLCGWHNFFVRPGSVVPMDDGYLFAYEGSNLGWYDPVYNIATGFGWSSDLHTIADRTFDAPVFKSATPGSFHTWRYGSWVRVGDELWAYAEVACPNDAFELRRFRFPMDSVRTVVSP